jgi:hypothetical protein
VDFLSCSRTTGTRIVFDSAAEAIFNPALTQVAGTFDISRNSILKSVVLPSLRVVADAFGVYLNPLVTFVSVPRLSWIGGFIYFCRNDPSFTIPEATLGTAPALGLKSQTFSAQAGCYYQAGTETCNARDICP